MRLKRDEHGHVVVEDGKPVYVHDDGKEIPFDVTGTIATISRLNGEAKSHRERAEGAEKSLKAFDGIVDPAAALAAIETVRNYDSKKLVDAGEVEKIKLEAKTAFEARAKAIEAQYDPIVKERDSLKTTLISEKIGGAFKGSKFITDKLVVPPDMVQATFGGAFKVEEGNIVGYDHTGKQIFSRERPGEVAQFDEALSLMVDAYPNRDHILKGSGASGGGALGGGGGKGGGKTMSRAAFVALPTADQFAHTRAGGTLTD